MKAAAVFLLIFGFSVASIAVYLIASNAPLHQSAAALLIAAALVFFGAGTLSDAREKERLGNMAKHSRRLETRRPRP